MPEVKENKTERIVVLVPPSFKERYTAYVNAITPAIKGKDKKDNVSAHCRENWEAELALYEANKT
jgi:hypothetical protein